MKRKAPLEIFVAIAGATVSLALAQVFSMVKSMVAAIESLKALEWTNTFSLVPGWFIERENTPHADLPPPKGDFS